MKRAIILSLLFSLVLFSACTETGRVAQPQSGIQRVKMHLIVEGKGSLFLDKEIEVEKGTNAFDVMKANVDLKFTEYEFGPVIEEIEGVKPAQDEFWALYVNGEMAPQGINAYILNEDIEIKWKIESQSSLFG